MKEYLIIYKLEFLVSGIIVFIVLGWFWNILPGALFDDPTSFIVEDRHGKLLSAKIAADEQWRFPYNAEVPEKFVKAITTFEDKRFFHHPGLDPLAIIRAALQNIQSGRVISGGSTITMQVIRLSRKGRARTFNEKIIESLMALRLELTHSKKEILALYAANAPFGGNVVGLDAAAWRYFGRAPERLSWAETVSLAVLPNNPALVHPGRNRDLLVLKKNRLLEKLYKESIIDSITCQLAMVESIPPKPKALPANSPHLLDRIQTEYKELPSNRLSKIHSTLDYHLQRQANEILMAHHRRLRENGIHNAAAVIIENESGEALAYVGNTGRIADKVHGSAVDIITSPRSTGSILKPFLFAAMLQDGLILPNTLVSDVPTKFGGFQPVNFNKQNEGAVPASEALYRSLNIPAVHMLKKYGISRFHYLLRELGLTTLPFPASHYGLSLILGGAEATLWDVAGIYAGMARTLNHYQNRLQKPYVLSDFRPAQFQLLQRANQHRVSDPPYLSAAAIWHTLEILTEVKRPDTEGIWKYFSSSQKIAWKTGTSYGFRDAWAIGCTPKYTIAVWAGNADGEGRPVLTGLAAAAPVLFDLFDLMPVNSLWFEMPVKEMAYVEICTQSGRRASDICDTKKRNHIPISGLQSRVCPYHKIIHLDATETWQVNSETVSPSEMIHRSWFILPPKMEWYFKNKQGSYRLPPPFHPNTITQNRMGKNVPMEMIYPVRGTRIFVPKELDGNRGKAVFEVAHRDPQKTVFWHLDNIYLGSTCEFHQMPVDPLPGNHHLVLVDEDGHRIESRIVIQE